MCICVDFSRRCRLVNLNLIYTKTWFIRLSSDKNQNSYFMRQKFIRKLLCDKTFSDILIVIAISGEQSVSRLFTLQKQLCDPTCSSLLAMKILCSNNYTRVLIHVRRKHHRFRRYVKCKKHLVNLLKIDLEGDCNLKEIFRKNYRKVFVNFFVIFSDLWYLIVRMIVYKR